MPKPCCEYERNQEKRRSKIRETIDFFIPKKVAMKRRKGKENERFVYHQEENDLKTNSFIIILSLFSPKIYTFAPKFNLCNSELYGKSQSTKTGSC